MGYRALKYTVMHHTRNGRVGLGGGPGWGLLLSRFVGVAQKATPGLPDVLGFEHMVQTPAVTDVSQL